MLRAIGKISIDLLTMYIYYPHKIKVILYYISSMFTMVAISHSSLILLGSLGPVPGDLAPPVERPMGIGPGRL